MLTLGLILLAAGLLAAVAVPAARDIALIVALAGGILTVLAFIPGV